MPYTTSMNKIKSVIIGESLLHQPKTTSGKEVQRFSDYRRTKCLSIIISKF